MRTRAASERYRQQIVLGLVLAVPICAPGIAGADDCQTAGLCFDRIVLIDEEATTSANAGIGDLNGDSQPDIVLIKGRHWPVSNQVLFGDGTGEFEVAVDIGDTADRSYTGALADFDQDDDLDLAVSNDNPDRSLVYLNDGSGLLSESSTFGQPQWNTRNISVADFNGDQLPDIVVANRGPRDAPSPNHICLNLGDGRFQTDCLPFSFESATTITPADLNADGLTDLVVPHRDGGQSHVYLRTSSEHIDFRAVPFGPPAAAIRATAVADFDLDGQMDIVAIHTGNSEGGDGIVDRGRNHHGVAIYFGRGNNEFTDGQIIGQSAAMPYALTTADLNQDGVMEVIAGYVEAPSIVFVIDSPSRAFREFQLDDNAGTTYGFAVGDLNNDGRPDIVIAKSGARNRITFANDAEPSH